MSRCVVGLALLLAACPEDPQPTERSWGLALDVGEEGGFFSVWGRSAQEVWAVGGQLPQLGANGSAIIYRRGAEGWTKVDAPAGTAALNWIHGSAEALWAVGNAGTALRYDGTAWAPVPTGVDVTLWGAFVLATDDVWAVGGDVFDPATPGVIIHYDGAAWSEATLPALDRESAALFKIWGTSPTQLFAVGETGVILAYDGTSWTQVESSTTKDLISLWGTGPGEILAVGGRDSAALARWDGAAWTSMPLEALSGLNGVWLDSSGEATIVGNLGTAARVPAATLAPETQRVEGVGFNVLHGVFGVDDGALKIAVGGSIDRTPPWVGVIYEY